MGKYVAGLIAAGLLAFVVKSAADDVGKRLTEVREDPQPSKADGEQSGLIPPGKGDAVTIIPFEDPLGYFRVMAPGVPEEVPLERTGLHSIGRQYRLTSNPRKLQLKLYAEFVGSDEPNTPRQTLSWVVKKDITLLQARATGLFDRVKFSRPTAGVEGAEYRHEWRGNGPSAHRVRHLLVKRWLYTAAAHGLPDEELDAPDVAAFFDSFAVTEKALAHPEGGAVKP
jgi:hypothetical protein